jgi:multiple sugar transport system substrate-binding protein
MRRFVHGPLGVAAVIAMLLLAACSGGGGGGGDGGVGSGASDVDADPATVSGGSGSSGDRVEIRWYVGLGTGENPEQIERQNEIVDAFNASQDRITLTIELVQNDVAYDTLATQIASGDGPDIVGPVGIRGANAFNGRWLDLEPLVEAAGYDLSRFPEEQVEVWRTDEGLIAIPFGVYPSLIYYNKALFDEAGLAYPPASIGEDYEGGTWDIDTITELGRKLTVDADGTDATDPAFNPTDIVQFGLEEQWSEAQRMATWFGAGSIVADDGSPQMPDAWRDAFHWYYDAMWSDHIIPNEEYRGSDLLAAGNPFDSGNVAMAHTHLWYTCCLEGVSDWDIAPVPSYQGTTTAALHADVFRILNTTKHPEEAFEVLTYLFDEAASDLLEVYGAMPADPSLTGEFFDRMKAKYPSVENWDVATESLEHPDIPSHEQDMPNFQKSNERIGTFWSELNSTPGLDVDAAIDTLLADLAVIFQES